MKRTYDLDQVRGIAEILGIDFAKSGYDLAQFQAGLDVEAEHGQADPATNVTNDDPLITGKIALAHLNEMPDYYTRLNKMEADAERESAPKSESLVTETSWRRKAGLGASIGVALLLFGVASAQTIRMARAKLG